MPVLRLACLLLFAVLGPAAFAQSYPARPVRIIVQFAPGGVPDLAARLMAEQLTKSFNQAFIVENRTGTGGSLATDFVAKAPADGYTLLLSASSPLAISPAIYRQLPFDPVRDFKPISLVGGFDFVMMVAPAFPAKNVSDFVALAKSNPGQYNFASSGYGSEHHLSGELLNKAAGIRLTHVPYKGFGPATVDTMANHVEMMFGSVPAAMPFIKSGKLRAMATSGASRDSNLPDVPTFAEAGYPEVKVISWVGLLVPAQTPQNVYESLVSATDRILQSPEVMTRLNALGLTPMPVGPTAMAERIKVDQKFWSQIVHDAGIKQVE